MTDIYDATEQFYFLVLTHPDKVWGDHQQVSELLVKKSLSYHIRGETGDKGDNPHLNVIVALNPQLRADNLKRDIMTTYYGKAFLEKHKDNKPFKIHGAKGKTAFGKRQLANVCVYLSKENTCGVEYAHGIDASALVKDMPTYQQHQALQSLIKTFEPSYGKLLDLFIETYYTLSHENTLNQFDNDYTLPIPDIDDFKNIVRRLSIEKYNLIPFYSKPKPFMLQFMAQLGNYNYVDLFLEKLVQDISPKSDFKW